ncbi:MAG: hypothetical protein R2941_06625 [Desulfobacterales bacterium]
MISPETDWNTPEKTKQKMKNPQRVPVPVPGTSGNLKRAVPRRLSICFAVCIEIKNLPFPNIADMNALY